VVEFPADLAVQIDNSPFIEQNVSDQTLVQIQTDLQAKGLDQHLSTSFTSGDKYYAHNSSVISSGFFDPNGVAIDLFQKLTQIDNELQNLRSLIAKAKGTLGVYITNGNTSTKIKPGSTVNFFAGYYNELIDLSNPNNKGKIATVTYYIELRNEAATPLELTSLIPGGQGVKAPDSIVGQQDYNDNRKYGETPVQLSGIVAGSVNTTSPGDFIQALGYQSGNAYSQFIYPRYKSVGLEENLYFTPSSTLGWGISNGSSSGGSNYPINNYGILMPFEPNTTSVGGAGSNSSIWNGAYSATIPTGGGFLNEFCIHISHPSINDGSATLFPDLERPSVTSSGPMTYPAFRHALGFEVDTNITSEPVGYDPSNPQNLSIQQLEFYEANSSSAFGTDDNAYPNKLGFVEFDEYLCGKFSCGAYLFLAPTDHNAVQVEGSTQLAKKTLEFGQENAITVPVIFQIRAQDKLGYIGGWRSAGNLKNITYTKKIGIDIQVKNEDLFSFDVLVSGSYTKTSLVSPAYSQNVITNK
jgi:hypothetical protein